MSQSGISPQSAYDSWRTDAPETAPPEERPHGIAYLRERLAKEVKTLAEIHRQLWPLGQVRAQCNAITKSIERLRDMRDDAEELEETEEADER